MSVNCRTATVRSLWAKILVILLAPLVVAMPLVVDFGKSAGIVQGMSCHSCHLKRLFTHHTFFVIERHLGSRKDPHHHSTLNLS